MFDTYPIVFVLLHGELKELGVGDAYSTEHEILLEDENVLFSEHMTLDVVLLSGALVYDLGHSHHIGTTIHDRHAENGVGPVASLVIYGSIESLILQYNICLWRM